MHNRLGTARQSSATAWRVGLPLPAARVLHRLKTIAVVPNSAAGSVDNVVALRAQAYGAPLLARYDKRAVQFPGHSDAFPGLPPSPQPPAGVFVAGGPVRDLK